MKRKSLTLLAALLTFSAIHAQKEFNKIVYKQPGTLLYHSGVNGTTTNTGGYAYAQSNGNNAYVAVFDSSLSLQWSKNINIQSTHKSAGQAIAQSTLDSSFCMIGTTYDPSRPEYDLLISKMSRRGKEMGTVSVLYGVSAGGYCRILPLPQGKFLGGLDANSAGTIGLMVLNAKGKFTTIKSLNYGSYMLLFQDLVPTSDGGFMLTGNVMYSFGLGQRDLFCCKLDDKLNIQWTKTYATGLMEEITGIIQAKDGGYFMYGYQYISSNTNSRFVKLDNNGNVQWNTLVHFSSNSTPVSAVQTSDGGYALTGIELYKLTKKGKIQWTSLQAFTDAAYPLFETKDNGLLTFSQYNSSQLNIVKTDSAGNTCNASYTRTYTLLSDSLIAQPAAFTISDGTVQQINTGTVFTDAGTSEYTLCQQSLNTTELSAENNIVSGAAGKKSFTVYPNPAKDKINIQLNADKNAAAQLVVTGAAGNTLLSKQVQNTTGTNIHQLNIAALKPGIYFLSLLDAGGKTTIKFVKE